MKLLALRGANLASLAASFSIDFEADPLRGAGIFAITGPTGAGKSTLLDAICLALFDSVPRLEGAESSARTGRVGTAEEMQITYGDVRGLLRHGAAEACAEVDFRGQDGRAYRSRWEVKRARSRADGRLQAQRMVLTDLATGQIIGDKKTETLREIERRVGLNFDQFRRAVLLAQGEFDTFIKARSQDRAELLERITSTAIYSRLSRAAFQRAKLERDALSVLEARAGEQSAMTPKERSAAEAALRERGAALDSARQEVRAAEQAGQWHEEASRLGGLVASADAQACRARDAEAACAEAQAILLKARLAFSVRAELETAALATKQAHEAAIALDKTRADVARAEQTRDAARTKRDDAAAKAVAAELAYAAAGPALDLANSLDTQIETSRQHVASLQTACHAAIDRNRLAAADVDDRTRMLETAEAERRRDAAWMEANPGVAALGPRLEDVLRDLEHRTHFLAEAASRLRTHAQLRDEAATARRQLERDEASIEGIERGLADVEGPLAELTVLIESFPRRTVSDRRDALLRAHAGLQAVSSTLAGRCHAEAARQAALAERTLQRALHEEADASLADATQRMPVAFARLEEAERNAALSRDTASDAATHLRALLRPGQPCAVCGSAHHGELPADDVLRARLARDDARVAELRAETTRWREMRAGQHSKREAAALAEVLAGERADKTAAEVTRIENELGHAAARVNAEAAWTGLCFDPATITELDLAGQLAALAEQAAAAALALSDDSRRQADMRALTGTRDDLRDRLEEARVNAVASGRAAERAHDQAVHEAEHLDAIRREMQSLEGRLDPLLSPNFEKWTGRTDLPDTCRRLVETWRECAGRLDLATPPITAAKEALAAAQATLVSAAAALAEARQSLIAASDSGGALAAKRLAVFEGQAVHFVRSGFEAAISLARISQADTELTHLSAEKAVSSACQARRDAERTQTGAKRNLAQSEDILSASLHAVGLEREAAASLVAAGQAWVDAEAQRLDGIRQHAHEAGTVLEERRRAHRAHLDCAAPRLSADEAAVLLTGLRRCEREAEAAFVTASGVVQANDLTRARRGEIEGELATRREAAQIWQRLDEMIGSQNGDKFRRYAQSLTLDQLISLANAHLLGLHPRYELERAGQGDAAGGLMLQVIDRSMGDEARGLHNLSGGERFIVSLALALGLASMSSSLGVQVESLFIDEGFGALDAQSLGMAISVLEQLQATGRQVGVISHVEELKERIAVKIEVVPVGGGRSRVQVLTS